MVKRSYKSQEISTLALKAIKMAGKISNELERSCWMVVHEYKHGSMPVEYDIKDIDENLYLAVLDSAKNLFDQ